MPCTVEIKCRSCGQMASPDNVAIPLWQAVKDMEIKFTSLVEHHRQVEKDIEAEESWEVRHDNVVAQRNILKKELHHLKHEIAVMHLQRSAGWDLQKEEAFRLASIKELTEALNRKVNGPE